MSRRATTKAGPTRQEPSDRLRPIDIAAAAVIRLRDSGAKERRFFQNQIDVLCEQVRMQQTAIESRDGLLRQMIASHDKCPIVSDASGDKCRCGWCDTARILIQVEADLAAESLARLTGQPVPMRAETAS